MARFDKVSLVIEAGQRMMDACLDEHLPWDALSVWVELTDDGRAILGYRYFEGEAHEWTPPQASFLEHIRAMRVAELAAKGRSWERALLHVSRPGPKLLITHDYEDPERLALDPEEIGVEAHAKALHPDNLWTQTT